MKYNKYYVSSKDGKSNCVIRSFCKIYNENYDNIYKELCNIANIINLNSYNDVEVFELYMKRRNTTSINYGKNIKIKNLLLEKGKYVVFCWDKLDYYHMIPIIDNIIYDKDDNSLELYVIKIYKQSV